MIHDKLDSMNDPMLIILSLDVAESPINQAFSIHGTEEEKLNIHSCHIKPTLPVAVPLSLIKPCGPIPELGLSDPPLTNL